MKIVKGPQTVFTSLANLFLLLILGLVGLMSLDRIQKVYETEDEAPSSVVMVETEGRYFFMEREYDLKDLPAALKDLSHVGIEWREGTSRKALTLLVNHLKSHGHTPVLILRERECTFC